VWFICSSIIKKPCTSQFLQCFEIGVGCDLQTVEKRPREMMLRREFANAVGYLNQMYPEERRLKFIHWDFHKFAKR
jgi:hypothetical protein